MTEKEKFVQQDTAFESEKPVADAETYTKLNSDTTVSEEPKKTRRAPMKRKSPVNRKSPAEKTADSHKEKTQSEPVQAVKEKELEDINPPEVCDTVNEDARDFQKIPEETVFEPEEALFEKDAPDAVATSDEAIIIPLFDIPDEETSSPSDELLSYDEEGDCKGEEILPPDMLFANINKSTPSDESQESDDSPPSDEEIGEEYSEDSESEENDENYGQYTIDGLMPVSEEKPKALPEYNPKKPRRVDSRFDLVELFVFTLVAVMILMSFFFRHSIVNGGSMENTLHDGEHLIISDFMYTPKRGDVIVCEDHTTNLKYPIVKRVIALGGDTVKITEDGVYVNGVPEENSHIYFGDPDYKYTPYEVTVPEGEIFVMGDHRDNSTDSRDPIMLGTVKEDAVLGKVLFRFLPFDKFGAID